MNERQDPAIAARPPISIFMTVRNEAAYIRDALAALYGQDYDGEMEIVIAVGPSDDDTRQILDDAAQQNPRLVVIDNPTGRTPEGLNLAIARASHDVLIRVDGHSVVPPHYVSTLVETLRTTGAANVGGKMLPKGRTPFQRAVANAMASRIGIGPASFHNGTDGGPAETVYLGAFARGPIEEVGHYDPHFSRAQDWELNYRLRSAGHVVWFSPEVGVEYLPRSRWRDLARQFYVTGQWRREVVRTHPGSRRIRYLIPPLYVVAASVGLAGAVAGVAAGAPAIVGVCLLPLATHAALLVLQASRHFTRDPEAALRLPMVIATMHVCWGAGYLRGVARSEDILEQQPLMSEKATV